MSDIVYEMTLYAKRAPEPYIRWAGEVIELKQRIRELELVNAELRKLLTRYRNETPLGHQPHMIAHEVDKALESSR